MKGRKSHKPKIKNNNAAKAVQLQTDKTLNFAEEHAKKYHYYYYFCQNREKWKSFVQTKNWG
jgi:hypothetical protein